MANNIYLLNHMSSRFRFFCLLILIPFGLFSCSPKDGLPSNRLSVLTNGLQAPRSEKIVIPRATLIARLGDADGVYKIRLVRILRGAMGEEVGPPEWRFFDIQPGSVYETLGLRNADILRAANDFIIYNPEKFKTYVVLLKSEKQAVIDIIRDREAIRMEYEFTD